MRQSGGSASRRRNPALDLRGVYWPTLGDETLDAAEFLVERNTRNLVSDQAGNVGHSKPSEGRLWRRTRIASAWVRRGKGSEFLWGATACMPM